MKTIPVQLIEDDAYEKSETFKVLLIVDTSPEKGIQAGKFTEAMITICGDEDIQRMALDVAELMSQNFEKVDLSSTSWTEQFNSAMNIEGEEGESAGFMDYTMHFLTFGWKVMFATCPPTSYYGGWATFFVALGMIGVLTAFIADIAGTFGCLLGLDDGITAITFVALGTSLPDTFASKSAAVGDETADNSVGNVTGSNSVNVYLGLGIPWVIATVVNTTGSFTPLGTCFAEDGKSQGESVRSHLVQGEQGQCDFPVEVTADNVMGTLFIRSGNQGDYPMAAGSLGFSVVIFCLCACTCIATIYLRRALFGAELGGPMSTATGLFFMGLWVTYVVVSSLETEGHIESFI
jgi:solute carrier family 8 (sodium/calcium exchanger)